MMNTNKPITATQIKQLHILLADTGMIPYKQDLMDDACIDGRYPTSSKELYDVEADAIITKLKAMQDDCDKMRKKVIGCCRECGMNVSGRADMDAIYWWVLKYGHAKKHLNKYNYNELVKLVNQADQMKRSYLQKLRDNRKTA